MHHVIWHMLCFGSNPRPQECWQVLHPQSHALFFTYAVPSQFSSPGPLPHYGLTSIYHTGLSTSRPRQSQTFPCISQNISLSITGLGTKDSSSPKGEHILASVYLSLARRPALHRSWVQILPFLCLLRLHLLICHISPNAESQKTFTLCDVLNENGTHGSYV